MTQELTQCKESIKTLIAAFDNMVLYKQQNGEMYTLSYVRNKRMRNLLLFKSEAERFKEAMNKKDKLLLEDALYRVL